MTVEQAEQPEKSGREADAQQHTATSRHIGRKQIAECILVEARKGLRHKHGEIAFQFTIHIIRFDDRISILNTNMPSRQMFDFLSKRLLQTEGEG